jgi:hypothetical protein
MHEGSPRNGEATIAPMPPFRRRAAPGYSGAGPNCAVQKYSFAV